MRIIIGLLIAAVLGGGYLGYFCASRYVVVEQTTCPFQCIAVVKSVVRLWPSLESALRLIRVIPQTQLACERICTAKQIRNL